jgi:phospholipase C
MRLSDRIKTVVIVMMENRSFDHMVGYLSLLGPRMDVDGLQPPDSGAVDYREVNAILRRPEYLNTSKRTGKSHYPFHMEDLPLTTDLPHDRARVALQVGTKSNAGYTMDGFVDAYEDLTDTRIERPDPLGFFTNVEVPMHDFFARSFTLCERWFSPIPTDTQPNRLMALTGFTLTDKTTMRPPYKESVLNWLDRNHISWRIYSEGLPFLLLIPALWPRIFTDNYAFRTMRELQGDLEAAATNPLPQVIFIEPDYLDSPLHRGGITPNDNHPPLPVGAGERFLQRVYGTLIQFNRREIWEQMVLIITYDEHGGFYDHVPPLTLKTECGDLPCFEVTGLRVPGFIVSPFIEPGRVYRKNLDHTSILEFLAEWLTPGKPYSRVVADRLASPGFASGRGKGRIAQALDLTTSNPPPAPPAVSQAVEPPPPHSPTQNELALRQAVDDARKKYRAQFEAKYGT